MSAQTPHVRLGTTTRAGGKIFIALEGAPKDATLLSQAHTPAGLSVPSKVYAMETGERVLVLPVLGVAQEVRLFGRDAAGTETTYAEATVRPQAAKLQSRVNTATKNQLAARIRNCDALPQEDEISIRALRVVPDAPADHLHLLLEYPFLPKEESGEEQLAVRVLNSDASVREDAARILGDATAPDQTMPFIARRYVTASIQVPHEAQTIIVEASAAGRANFACYEPSFLADQANVFAAAHVPACDCEGYECWAKVDLMTPAADSNAQPSVCVAILEDPTNQRRLSPASVLQATNWQNLSAFTVSVEGERGYADAIAEVVARAEADYVVFVSSAARIASADWLRPLVEALAHDGVGAAGPVVVYADGTRAGGQLAVTPRAAVRSRLFCPMGSATGPQAGEQAALPHEVTALSSTCIVLARGTLAAIAPLDPGATGLTWAFDLCHGVHELGLSIVEQPQSVLQAEMPLADMGVPSYAEHERWLRAQGHMARIWPEPFGLGDPYYDESLDWDGNFTLRSQG